MGKLRVNSLEMEPVQPAFVRCERTQQIVPRMRGAAGVGRGRHGTAAPFLFHGYLPPSTGIKSLQFYLFIYLSESLVVSKDVLIRARVISALEGKGNAFESGRWGNTKASLQRT